MSVIKIVVTKPRVTVLPFFLKKSPCARPPFPKVKFLDFPFLYRKVYFFGNIGTLTLFFSPIFRFPTQRAPKNPLFWKKNGNISLQLVTNGNICHFGYNSGNFRGRSISDFGKKLQSAFRSNFRVEKSKNR